MSNMNNKSGFTLVELAISTMIFGLAMVAFLAIYKPYVVNEKIETTNEGLVDIYAALENYKIERGFYPCPSSLTAVRGAADYGYASNCADTTTVEGTCSAADGYCVRQSDLALGLANPRVRVGAVPFRELNISEEKSYDAFGSRYYMAMTESLAIDPSEYDDANGGIQVVDSRPVVITDSAKFIIFSVGANQVGGYNRQGNEFASCATGGAYNGADKQNCETLLNATFAFTGEVGAGLADEMDDFVQFDDESLNQTTAGWRIGNPDNTDSVGNPENINDVLTSRAVKVGDFEETPRHELDVSGDAGDMRTENALVASNGLCNYTDGGTGAADGCFNVANFEVTCGDGEYVTGLGPEDGTNVICSPIVFRCGDGEMIVGVDDSTGLPLCEPIPSTVLTPGSESAVDVSGVTASSGNGEILGTLGSNGEIIDGAGNVVGELGENGTILDGSGNVIGELGTGGSVTDGNGNVVGTIGSGGTILDGSGGVIGTIGAGGIVTDGSGNVLGTISGSGAGGAGGGVAGTGTAGSGGTITSGSGDVIGTIGEGGTILDGSGNVIGTLGAGGTVIDGSGNTIGTIGAGGTVVNGSGDIIGVIGAGGTVTDGSGDVIGEVGGDVTTEIIEEDEQCTEIVENTQHACTNGSGLFYDEYEIYSCETEEWVAQGNNETSACCNKDPNPTDTVSTATNFGSPSWVCGAYGKGNRRSERALNSQTCSYYTTATTTTCECKDPGTGFENPADYDPELNYIAQCAEREFTYPKAGNGRCTSRTEGALLDAGSVSAGSFAWTLSGASPDNVDPIGPSTRQEGDSCSSAGDRNRCASQNPVSGSDYQYYNGCTCEIIAPSSPVTCN